MNLKVKSRSIIIWNMAIFLGLSFLFLHVQIALIREISALNFSLIKINLFNLKEILVVIVLAIYSVLNLKKWSQFAYFLAVASVTGFTIFLLSENFSKSILVALGLYLAIAYYFYQFLILELEEACYNPGFHEKHLFSPMLKKIEVTLKNNEEVFQGYLTNWNENSCYIYLKEITNFKNLEEIICHVHFCDKNFESLAKITSLSKDQRGVGLRFIENKDETFNWESFYTITEQQGLTAELIK